MTPPTLLVSLGTSPAIVPEAFLLPDADFTAVHVLTTESPDVTSIQEFFRQHAPEVALTITRVAGFTDFASETDHFNFEEVLYRWILQAAVPVEHRFICLSGGFKTMSAAMQKAAAVLGAAQVFHVLADNCCINSDGKACPPHGAEEIYAARDQGHLHYIRLGSESGWPQLRATSRRDYPLEVCREADGVAWARVPDQRFRQYLRTIVERSHNIAGAWDQLADLPFPVIATWSRDQLNWLHEPLDPIADRSWVENLPKIELHTHLGGFATNSPLLDEVRSAAEQPDALPPKQPVETPEAWPLPAKPIGLDAYMPLGDNSGTRLLCDPGCLRRQCELLYAALCADNVVYAEVRCSPVNYATPEAGRSAWNVLSDIRNHFDRLMRDSEGAPNRCYVNLLMIGTRRNDGDRSALSRHLALAITAAQHWTDGCRVVGVDLAGFESPATRAGIFTSDFEAVHRVGLAVTIHAGENDDAEGIWQAVFKLNARRIGHGLRLRDSPDLLRAVADRGIGVEMCPYANVQIAGFAPVVEGAAVYPLADYLSKGVKVSVHTDNIGISAATLSDNLLLLAILHPGLRRLDVLRLVRNAVETAFVEADDRSKLFRRVGSALTCAGYMPLPVTEMEGNASSFPICSSSPH